MCAAHLVERFMHACARSLSLQESPWMAAVLDSWTAAELRDAVTEVEVAPGAAELCLQASCVCASVRVGTARPGHMRCITVYTACGLAAAALLIHGAQT